MTFMFLVLACFLSIGMLIALDLLSFSLGRVGWRRFISTYLLFLAQVIGTEFLLGASFLLYSYSLALLNIAIMATLTLVIYKRYGPQLFKEYLENLKKIPTSLKLYAKQDILLTLLYGLAGIFLAWVLFLGIIFPPLDWDGNAYHLTYAANLVQEHNIYDQPTSLVWVPAYPKGGEFIQAWTLLLSHNDMLVDLTQVPFMVLAIVSLYAIARNVGISKRSSRYASFLFVFTPSALNQLTTGYVDLMLAAVFLTALALTLQKTYKKLDFLLIGMALSLLISIKASGVYMVAVLLALLLWNLYKHRGLAIKSYILPAAIVASPMFFGLYWYIKNLVLYGSPVYPFGLQFAGKTIFEGMDYAQWSSVVGASMPGNPLARWWYTWSEHAPDPGQFVYNYDSSYFGLGTIWFMVLLPAILVSIYFSIRQRRYYFLGVLLLLFGLLVIYPVNFSPRYTMFILAAGVIGFGLLIDNLSLVTVRITKVVVLVLAAFTLAINFVLWSYAPHTVHDQVTSIQTGQGQHGPGTIFPINFGNAYTLLHNTVTRDQTIVYTSGNWIYPLWNDQFSNKVVYIDAQTEAIWYKQVKAMGADYIFTTTEPNVRQNHWAANKFKNVIYKDAAYEVFKVD